jgi:hypothetical protein
MIGPEEEQIRRFFRTARQLEESQAPGFYATIAGARRLAVHRGRTKVLAAVTVMILFAILSVVVITRTGDEADLPSSRAVLYWESPTQAYLSAPGEGVLAAVATSEGNRADRSKP